MNCKPGDLAMYVGKDERDVGRIVTCVRLFYWSGRPSWVVDPPLSPAVGFRHDAAFDTSLRPIRDPGEDARDETLDWLPVPHKDLA